jgi:MAP/microtubule affinity-regulating kinase
MEGGGDGNIDDYTVGRQLGQGAYATVKYAVHKRTNHKFAVKTYDKVRLLDPSRKKSVHREIKILGKLEHPHIVKLFDTIEAPRQLHLVMEYLAGGSLHYHLKRSPNRHLTEAETKRLFRQVLSAIEYCHSLNVTHRDLKLENILLDDRRNIKLIDFGFATCFPNDKKAKIFCGTPSYMSPEIVARKEYYGPPADVWALGVLLFVMLSGVYPFKGRDDKDLYRKIIKGQFEVPQVVAAAPRAMIHRMMSIDPSRRPSVKELLSDAWLNGLHMSIDLGVTITRTNSTYMESKAIDLDVVSKIKLLGFPEAQVMQDLHLKDSNIAKLYRRIKHGDSYEHIRPMTVAT